MTIQFDTPWQRENLAKIKERLAVHSSDDDLAKIIPSRIQGVFVRTVDGILELYCYDPKTRNLSDIMSRVSLSDPLEHMAAYAQVMSLSFIWPDNAPERVYIAGFGGGRLAMGYHHHNPTAYIDGSDFDPAILDVASEFFGINYDERYSVNAADSFEDFDSRNYFYDTVIIDVFSSSGQHASHLASLEFFQKCKAKLSPQGIVAINLIERDENRVEKITNLAAVFPHLTEWRHQGSHIIFASVYPFSTKQLVTRAERFEKRANLNYPFAQRARELRSVDTRYYDIA